MASAPPKYLCGRKVPLLWIFQAAFGIFFLLYLYRDEWGMSTGKMAKAGVRSRGQHAAGPVSVAFTNLSCRSLGIVIMLQLYRYFII